MDRKTFLFMVASLGLVIGGCESSTPPLTKEEQAKFKGGPMPPGTWEKMAASKTSWEEQHGLKATGGKPNPNQVTGGAGKEPTAPAPH